MVRGRLRGRCGVLRPRGLDLSARGGVQSHRFARRSWDNANDRRRVCDSGSGGASGTAHQPATATARGGPGGRRPRGGRARITCMVDAHARGFVFTHASCREGAAPRRERPVSIRAPSGVRRVAADLDRVCTNVAKPSGGGGCLAGLLGLAYHRRVAAEEALLRRDLPRVRGVQPADEATSSRSYGERSTPRTSGNKWWSAGKSTLDLADVNRAL